MFLCFYGGLRGITQAFFVLFLLSQVVNVYSLNAETSRLGPAFQLKSHRIAKTPERDKNDDITSVLIHVQIGVDLEVLVQQLTEAGYHVTRTEKNRALIALSAPWSLMNALSTHPAVLHMELVPTLKPLLDKSVRDIGADEVWQGHGLNAPRTGKGVLVGLLDTGIDWSHPAFYNEEGHTRIVAIWDQDGQGPHPPGYGYGTLCSRDTIDNKKCPIVDTAGHGSHVAGIMAGTMTPYKGIAPEAEIVVVKSSQFTDVVSAVNWMFEVADTENKPIVINLSIGGHLGAHDGQSEVEQTLEELQAPGKIIVAAAGNDGANRIHLSDFVFKTEHRSECLLPPPGLANTVMLDIWEQTYGRIDFALELYDDAGKLLNHIDLDSSQPELDVYVGDKLQGKLNYASEVSFVHHKNHHLLTIDRASVNLAEKDVARWFLVFSGQGSFDAWLSSSDDRYGIAQFADHIETLSGQNVVNFVPGDTTHTLTIPGTARELITVGSFTTKNQWQTERGRSYELPNASLYVWSSFSSQGPTTAPELTGDKPDIVAPGQLIVGPRSSYAKGVSSTLNINSYFTVLQGTSMAAPHAAGVVALMLEADPKLTPQQAKRILIESSQFDSKTDGARPNAKIGYGRLSALAAMQKMEGIKSVGCRSYAQQENECLAMLIGMWIVFAARKLYQKKKTASSFSWNEKQ